MKFCFGKRAIQASGVLLVAIATTCAPIVLESGPILSPASAAVGTGAAGTLDDYWNGTAEWTFLRKETAASTGIRNGGFYEGTGVNVMPDGTWYMFSRRVTTDFGACGTSDALDTVVRKSIDKGATWSAPVVVVSHAAGTPYQCAATDGTAYYNATENKWHLLFQCLNSSSIWNGCELSRAGSDPMGTFTIAPTGGNPVVSAQELWNSICNISTDDCSVLAGGAGRVHDEGTFDIFNYDGTYYWVGFHGYDGVHGYRGIAKTTNFQTWVAGDASQGVPADAVLDAYDMQPWREAWNGGSIGIGTGSVLKDGSYYYQIAEAADVNLGCTDGQHWDHGLFRTASLTSTSWAQVPRGNPIVYSSTAAEPAGYWGAAGIVLRCNVVYSHLFKDPSDGATYLVYGRRSNDPNYDGEYWYRLEKSTNLLINSDFWRADTYPWQGYGASTNAVAYRTPNNSPDGTPYLASNCGGPCTQNNSIYQDVAIAGGSAGSLKFGGKFMSEGDVGNLTLYVYQMDQSYNLLQIDPVTFSTGTKWAAVSQSVGLLASTRILRYQYFMNSNITYRVDDLYLQATTTSDVTAPTAVSNLGVKVGQSTATLSWTAPGNDGSMGTAASYDVRYSTAPITQVSWSSATQASGEPAPTAAGNLQRFKVTGLAGGVTYYFAIKTTDSVSNLSALSNVPSVKTVASTESSTNQALDAAASSSSTSPGYSAQNVNDGSADTSLSLGESWTNNVGTLPQWVQLDWATARTFNQVELYTTSGYEISDYQLQYWNGSAWVDLVAPVTGNTSPHRTHGFASVTATKIRALGNNGPVRQTSFVRLNEIEVYNSDNLALGAAASASTTYAGYAPGRINDGSTDTTVTAPNAWANDGVGALPQWVQLDFGTSRTFNRVELFTSAGYEIRDYELQYWSGSTWLDATGAVTLNTATRRLHLFNSITASKVRLLGNSGPNVQTAFVRVNELRIFNTTDLAIGATASASTTYAGYAASKINDGSTAEDSSTSSSWVNDGYASLPQWVQLDWITNRTFNCLYLYSTVGYVMADYQVQYWNGSSWYDLFIPVTGNNNPEQVHCFPTVTGSKIRVLGNKGSSAQGNFVRVNELAVFKD